MKFQLRPFAMADLPRLVEMYNTFRDEPLSEQEFEEWLKKVPDGALLRMVTAEDGEGRVIGYGESTHMPWSDPGRFWIEAVVDPAARRQGLGAALIADLERFGLEHGATRFDSFCRDNMEEARQFMFRRGYQVRRHTFESTLDLNSFDPAPFDGIVERVRDGGIRFFVYADEPGERLKQELYEFAKETAFDMPGWDSQQYLPYDQWHKFVFESEEFRPELLIIAAEGGRVAGITRMGPNKKTGALYTHWTGVRKEYRGRHIALALKLLAVEAARGFGAPYMRTNNDSLNQPMLAVNRKLGYVPVPGWYQLWKVLEAR
jgi:GNAT superfamily N-acetyltransferase